MTFAAGTFAAGQRNFVLTLALRQQDASVNAAWWAVGWMETCAACDHGLSRRRWSIGAMDEQVGQERGQNVSGTTDPDCR
jgi:hypothetical protein